MLGVLVLVLSFIPALLAVWALRRAKTTIDVRRKSTALVETGIFRVSRNPIYLSMILLCIGLALVFDSLAMLIMVIPAAVTLDLAVIRKEEANLSLIFGPAYEQYCRTVRRWI